MKLNWGILGAAKIAVEKVIPAMANSDLQQVLAIASRKQEKANAAAEKLGIPKAYGSYEELIADPDIDIIYNPLPNHLHAEYTIKCMEAGKHVLCEKPIALKNEDVLKMIAVRDRQGVKAGEAFMVKTHPQWIKTRELVQKKALGDIRLIQGCFSYSNTDPGNIRNIADYGGGAVWDIGCYPVFTSRFVLGEEPLRVVSQIEHDPDFGVDKLVSVIMLFPSAQVTFSVSTQMVPHQRMRFFGEHKELEIKIPFNAPNDRPCEILLHTGDVHLQNVETIKVDVCDQYRIMTEAFSKAVNENGEVPVTLEYSLANTRVLEAIFQSAREGKWVEV
jgi:predicted dehydrogenase